MNTLPNLRDLAGTATVDGRVLAPGRLLRSAMPFADDVVGGTTWPPSVVVDLRSSMETARHPTIEASRNVNLPLLSLLAPDTHLDGTLVALYLALLDSADGLLVDLVHEVADSDGPVLVHCAAGKDRTGIAVALLLRLVGVERDAVLHDYRATDQHIDAIDERLRAMSPTGERRELPREYFHVVPAALEAVLDRWDGHEAGTRGWILDAGADRSAVDALSHRLLASG